MIRNIKPWALLIALLINTAGFAQQTTDPTDPTQDPGPTGGYTICEWSSLPSGGSSCSAESCGAGCNIVAYGPPQTECYTGGYPSPGCCICTWQNTYCQCTFGSGTGRTKSSSFQSGAHCTAVGSTAPYTYKCEQATTIDPTDPTPVSPN